MINILAYVNTSVPRRYTYCLRQELAPKDNELEEKRIPFPKSHHLGKILSEIDICIRALSGAVECWEILKSCLNSNAFVNFIQFNLFYNHWCLNVIVSFRVCVCDASGRASVCLVWQFAVGGDI